jgi:UDP-N-acetylglucosamine 1-carboxyvinyltransferase
MGADIRIEGHHALGKGVPQLSGAPVRCPDLRGGAALVLAGLVAEGETIVGDVHHIDRGYERFVEKLQGLGADVEELPDALRVRAAGPMLPAELQTLPYPGFPTDMQAQFMALVATADGGSIITENVFENRFMFADELVRMGADIRIEGHHGLVRGVDRLSGAPVRSTDLRGGAALVLAGLIAEGRTVVGDVHHIDRGYERFVDKLAALGADVSRAFADPDAPPEC